MKRARSRDSVLALGLAAQAHLLATLHLSGAEYAQVWNAEEQARDARIEQTLRDLVTEGLMPGSCPGVTAERPQVPGPAADAHERV